MYICNTYKKPERGICKFGLLFRGDFFFSVANRPCGGTSLVGGNGLFYQYVECCARMSRDEVKSQNFKYSPLNLDQNTQ